MPKKENLFFYHEGHEEHEEKAEGFNSVSADEKMAAPVAHENAVAKGDDFKKKSP